MKKHFFIFLLIFYSFSIFSDIVDITQNNDAIIFGNRNSIFIDENQNIYITYGKRIDQNKFLLYFSYSPNDSNQFSETFIDTLYNYPFIKEKSAPVLTVSNNIITIFYNKSQNPSEFNLWKAFSIDNGNTFEKEFIDYNVFLIPSIIENNENLILTYIRGKKKYLNSYQYYSNYEISENSTNLPFNQIDTFNGPIFSNDDIYITATTTSYPAFNSLISTAKNFYINGNIPLEQLFPKGYLENVPEENYSLPDDFDPYMPFASYDADIVYVILQGNHYISKLGRIIETGTVTIPVYSWYPQNAQQAQQAIENGYNWLDSSNIIYENQVTLYDTIWIDGPAEEIENYSVIYTNKELWIKGVISERQLWISGNNVYIVGDITYQNTPIGSAPDDPDIINQHDYFGLISQKKIIIKYKYKDPMNNFETNTDNCDGLNLYGAYCAIEEADSTQYGEETPHFDGTFTFEYQHPHGSTPNFIGPSPYTGNDTLYTFVDLHKFIYPPNFDLPENLYQYNIHGGAPIEPYMMCGYPYENPDYLPYSNIPPYGTDYPWYNPVWPESAENIITERGTINLFGATYQARKGYIHRSGNDPYNHPSDNIYWNLNNGNYIFATSHPSTGYYKNYHFDTRLLLNPFDEFPTAHLNIPMQNIVLSVSENNGQSFQNHFIEPVPISILKKSIFPYQDGYIFFVQSLSSIIFCVHILTDGTITNIDNINLTQLNNTIILKKAFLYNDKIYFLASDYTSDYIFYHQIDTDDYVLLATFEKSPASDYILSEDETAFAYYIFYQNQQLNIIGFSEPESNEQILYNPIDLNFQLNPHSKLLAKINNFNAQFIIKTFNPQNQHSSIKYLSTTISFLNSNINNLPELPIVEYKSYPNPFKLITKEGKTHFSIMLNLPKMQHIKIAIFNLKGKLVKILYNDTMAAGKHNIIWNGKNKSNKEVSSGIYFYKIETKHKKYINKFTLLK